MVGTAIVLVILIVWSRLPPRVLSKIRKMENPYLVAVTAKTVTDVIN